MVRHRVSNNNIEVEFVKTKNKKSETVENNDHIEELIQIIEERKVALDDLRDKYLEAKTRNTFNEAFRDHYRKQSIELKKEIEYMKKEMERIQSTHSTRIKDVIKDNRKLRHDPKREKAVQIEISKEYEQFFGELSETGQNTLKNVLGLTIIK